MRNIEHYGPMMVEPLTPDDILNFWFGDSLTKPDRLGHYITQWYRGDATLDKMIALRFSAAISRAGEGLLEFWTASPRGRLAVILLLDQFARNAFRGSSDAFKYGRQAVSLTRVGLGNSADRELLPLEQEFFYMPLLHSEQLEDQDLSVACFERLSAEASLPLASHLSETVAIARRYRATISRFGRFPHRNKQLGRKSLPSESFFLLVSGVRKAMPQIWQRKQKNLGI